MGDSKMKMLISICCVLLVFDLPVKSEESETDCCKNSNKIIKRHSNTNFENTIITSDLNNGGNIGISTTPSNIINQGIALPNLLQFHVAPGYNEIPKKALNVQRNSQIPRKPTALLSLKVPSADIKNHNYKPFGFLSNDTNISNNTNDYEDSNSNTLRFSEIPVIPTNEIKDIPIIETTIKPECKEENTLKTTVNVVINENDHHKNNHKHHHKHHHHHNKNENKTNDISADIDQFPEKEEFSIDPIFYKSKLEDVTTKEEDQEMDDMKEITESPTKFEESELPNTLSNQNIRKWGSNIQDLNKTPSIIENQPQKGCLLYSEIRPGFDKGKLNNKMSSSYNQYQPQNNIMYNDYHNQPCHNYRSQLRQNYQPRHYMNLPFKLNKNSLNVPCIYKNSRNNKPYYEFDLPNCYARGLKDYTCLNNDKLSINDEQVITCNNDEQVITSNNMVSDMEQYDDTIKEIIELVNDSFRQLNDKLQEYRISEKYDKQCHFNEGKHDVEHLKITDNWNDALKDIGCVKSNDFDSWYKHINQIPMFDRRFATQNNNRFLMPKKNVQ